MTTRRNRAENRAAMESAILSLGREQLASRGAAALSLRAIARELGVASSAVYRYVESRDALLTLLLVDAYTSLADNVDDRVVDAAGEDQLLVLAMTMREWALAHPEQWGLIYGAPVPGYEAPAEQTSAPGIRVMRCLLRITAQLQPLPDDAQISGEYEHFLVAAAEELDVAASVASAALAVRAWCTIVGAISMELFGQLGPEPRQSPDLGCAILESALSGFLANK